MKLHERSTQRFVKEYANWKISILEDMARSFPEKEVTFNAHASIIRSWLKRWEQGMIPTDEIMAKIASF